MSLLAKPMTRCADKSARVRGVLTLIFQIDVSSSQCAPTVREPRYGRPASWIVYLAVIVPPTPTPPSFRVSPLLDKPRSISELLKQLPRLAKELAHRASPL